MKLRLSLVLTFAFASVALQPSSFAEDKKKKKEMTKADYDQQWKLEQMKRNQAAQQPVTAAVRKPIPQKIPPAAPAGDGYVQVTVANQSAMPLEAVRFLEDDSAKSFGTIPAWETSTLRTRPGMRWVFRAGGQPVRNYVVTNVAQQYVAIGQPAPAAPLVPVYAKVRLLIHNQTGAAIRGTYTSSDGGGSGSRMIQPTGNGQPASLETTPGTTWTFSVNGQVLSQYTVQSQPQQPIAFGPLRP